MTDRDKILSSLEEREVELRWDPGYLLAWTCGYYMLFMFLVVPLILFLPIENKDSKIYAWMTIPILPTILAALVTYKAQKDRVVTFSRHGFRTLNRDRVLAHFLWNEIASITNHRRGFVIHRNNGTKEVAAFPQFKMNEDARQFLVLLKTFKSKNAEEFDMAKWLRICIPMLILGSAVAFGVGRPAATIPGYDGPIGVNEVSMILIWGCATMCWIAGAFGLTTAFMVRVNRGLDSANRAKTSHVGPTIQAHLESSHNWPVPLELLEGVEYRYLDPEGVRASIRERAAGLWTLAGFASFFALASLATFFFGSRAQQSQDPRGLAFAVAICLIGALVALMFGIRFSRWKVVVDDVISISDNALVVKRNGQELRFSKTPQRPMPTQFQKREARRPFGQTETYTNGTDSYVMDRRYLIPVE